MDEAVITALEEAVADLGALLLQLEKFRAAAAPDGRALRAACLAIGDRARRAHRYGALDPALAAELSADAAAARAALERCLADVRASAAYRDAVAALRAGDPAVLRQLASLYAGVAVAEPPDALFHPVDWQRRGRPRDAGEIADALAVWRRDGLPGDVDPAAPGVDPELPGVVLQAAPPPGAPLVVVLRGAARPRPVLALEATGDVVVPGASLRVAFAVALGDPDADDVDAWRLEPAAYREALAAALGARGIPIDDAT